MTDALILSAVRTPIGKYLGAFSDVPAPQLGAVAIREALKRVGAAPDRVDEVIVGNVLQPGLAQSQQRAAAAAEKGLFKAEIVPVTVGSGPKARTVDRDEGIRAETTREGLAKLKAAFREGGSVTAGNASTLSDGAAAVVVASPRAAEQLGRKPMARVIAYSTSGVAPKDIFIAPVLAVRQVLEKAGLRLGDIADLQHHLQ